MGNGTARPNVASNHVFIVKSLLDIPPYHSWLKFKAWADQYGPIFKLNIAGGDQYSGGVVVLVSAA